MTSTTPRITIPTLPHRTSAKNAGRQAAFVAGALALAMTAQSATTPAAGADPAATSSSPEYLVVGASGTSGVTVLKAQGPRLTKMSTAPTKTSFSLSLRPHPNGKWVYSAGVASSNIQAWHLTSAGRLVPLAGGGITDAGGPVTGLGFSPDGRYLVATVGSVRTTLVTYRVSSTGGLTPVHRTDQPNPVSALGHPLFTPDGKHVYVPSFVACTMDAYSFSDSGELTHIGTTQAAGLMPALGQVTPDGKYLYIGNEQSHNINGWRINRNGTLTPIGAPFVGLVPHGMAVTSDSRYAYAPMTMGMNVASFRIGRNGTLNTVASTPTGLTSPPARVVLSQDQKWLYVIDVASLTGLTSHVSAYRRLSGGRLAKSGTSADTGLVFTDGDTAFTIRPSA
ncbi:lactonase family protein [Gordonia sihwensis]|uniref:lactonase family protein n=1 Tax=Gordonia sihwensis TaxID=173559 RepID=UPI0005EFC073|nr:beta-propeller fold lactonase family protein [Gordonia sihwensis]